MISWQGMAELYVYMNIVWLYLSKTFLTDCFARKNVDDTVIFATMFITGMNQVHLITNNIDPLQSGSVFYERAKLTGVQYKHRYIFSLDGNHRVILLLEIFKH